MKKSTSIPFIYHLVPLVIILFSSFGSTPGFAMQAAQAAAHPTTYTLQKGEFPYCIARRFNVDPAQLLMVNNLSPNQIFYTGLVLSLPIDLAPFPGSRTLRAHGTYTIRSTDTIGSIACLYGDVAPEDIMSFNGIPDANHLPIGQIISIPPENISYTLTPVTQASVTASLNVTPSLVPTISPTSTPLPPSLVPTISQTPTSLPPSLVPTISQTPTSLPPSLVPTNSPTSTLTTTPIQSPLPTLTLAIISSPQGSTPTRTAVPLPASPTKIAPPSPTLSTQPSEPAPQTESNTTGKDYFKWIKDLWNLFFGAKEGDDQITTEVATAFTETPKPPPTATAVPVLILDPDTLNFQLPDDVIQEINYAGVGGGGGGAFCDNEPLNGNTNTIEFPAFPDAQSEVWADHAKSADGGNIVLTFLDTNIDIINCGWDPGDVISAELIYPNGKVDSMTAESVQFLKGVTWDGFDIPYGDGYSAKIHFYVDVNSPEGEYHYQLKASGGRSTGGIINLIRPVGPHARTIKGVSGIDHYYLYGFAPSENIRIFLYRNLKKDESEPGKMMGWKPAQVNEKGQLDIDLNMSGVENLDKGLILLVVGDQSGTAESVPFLHLDVFGINGDGILK